jgi:hypothetical protein
MKLWYAEAEQPENNRTWFIYTRTREQLDRAIAEYKAKHPDAIVKIEEDFGYCRITYPTV